MLKALLHASLLLSALSLIFGAVSSQAAEDGMLQVEIKSVDLPTFRTGERGPLLGRVVLRLRDGMSLSPLSCRAVMEIPGLDYRAEGQEQLVYPGLSAALDFPLELAEPPRKNTVLAGRLTITVEGRVEGSRDVPVYVRQSGMHFRTYRSRIDEAVYPYALYLPEGVGDPGRKWPLVVSLHGAWSNHANNLRRLFGIGNRPGEPDEMVLTSLPIWPELPKVEGIVLCPWGRGTMSYHGPGAQDVLEVLERVREYLPGRPGTGQPDRAVDGRQWDLGVRPAPAARSLVGDCPGLPGLGPGALGLDRGDDPR